MSSLLSRAFLRMRCACSARAAAFAALAALPLLLALALPSTALSQGGRNTRDLDEPLKKACKDAIWVQDGHFAVYASYLADWAGLENPSPDSQFDLFQFKRDPDVDYGPITLFACGEGDCWRAELRSRKDPGAACEIDTSRPPGEEVRLSR
jgi:hypothetical protein